VGRYADEKFSARDVFTLHGSAPAGLWWYILSPQGETLNQSVVESLAADSDYMARPFRRRGERLITAEVDREVSLRLCVSGAKWQPWL